MRDLRLNVDIECWPLRAPFRIADHIFDAVEVVLVSLEKDGAVGRGEAAGVFYRDDLPSLMVAQIESVRDQVEAGVTRESLLHLIAAGGARNALDCALWELEAQMTGRSVSAIAGLDEPKPLLTTFTCGADVPDRMAAAASAYATAKAIKIKLTGDSQDVERVRAVRRVRPDVWLGIDANQSLSRLKLDNLLPILVDEGVSLIEQPFPVGEEALLDGLHSPIPIAADESAQTLADLPRLMGRFEVINIKLDKCGGLTEGLALARAAAECGMQVMVGNMLGTSLAMAPAFVLGQLCDLVDLDGPVFLKTDRRRTVQYVDGYISCPDDLWGGARTGLRN